MKSSHLAAHKQSHMPAKRIACPYPGCNATLSTNQHLKTHEALHTEPAPYKVSFLCPSNIDRSVWIIHLVMHLSARNIFYENILRMNILMHHYFHVHMLTRDVHSHLMCSLR